MFQNFFFKTEISVRWKNRRPLPTADLCKAEQFISQGPLFYQLKFVSALPALPANIVQAPTSASTLLQLTADLCTAEQLISQGPLFYQLIFVSALPALPADTDWASTAASTLLLHCWPAYQHQVRRFISWKFVSALPALPADIVEALPLLQPCFYLCCNLAS